MTTPRYGRTDEQNEAQPGAALAPNPDQVNEFHRYDDSDNSPESHHHTLGVDPNQASPGDHNHDGKNSFLISDANGAGVHSHTDGLMQSTQLLNANLNDLRESGYYDCNNCTNAPPGFSWYHILHLNHNNNNGYVIQRAWRLDGADSRIWQRQQIGGTWGSWYLATGSLVAEADNDTDQTIGFGVINPVQSLTVPVVSGRRYKVHAIAAGGSAYSSNGAGSVANCLSFWENPGGGATFDITDSGNIIAGNFILFGSSTQGFFFHDAIGYFTATTTGNITISWGFNGDGTNSIQFKRRRMYVTEVN